MTKTKNNTDRGCQSLQALFAAMRQISFKMPKTKKLLDDVESDFVLKDTAFNRHMAEVEGELNRGCRQFKGDII